MSQYPPPCYYGNPMFPMAFPPYAVDPMFMAHQSMVPWYPMPPQPTPQLQMGSTMLTPDSDDVTRRSPNPSEQIGFEWTPTGRPEAENGGRNDRKRKWSDVPIEERNEEDGQEDKENNENAPPLPKQSHQEMESRVVECKPEVFCRVAGRLTVVGNPETYEVCVNEVCRRVQAPESLNKSTLGPLLRRGKIKGCGDELTELIRRRGLQWSKQHKKKSFSNCFTAFLEGESFKFAADHHTIITKHFPFLHLARMIIMQSPSILQCKVDATSARLLLEEQLAVFEELTVGGAAGTSQDLHPLKYFSLLTHYFGVLEWKELMNMFHRIASTLEEECTLLLEHAHRNYQSDMPGTSLSFEMNTDSAIIHRETPSEVSPNFTEVPGRLALDNRKYTITVAEVNRRIRGPESLNLSILTALLRKGKTSENARGVKEELAKHGINLPQGRRKEAPLTVFTALLEEEAIILARDHNKMITNHFPLHAVASSLNHRARCTMTTAIEHRRIMFRGYTSIANQVADFLKTSQLAISDRPNLASNRYAYIINDYSTLTHGFGPDEALNWFELFVKLAETTTALLPITPMM